MELHDSDLIVDEYGNYYSPVIFEHSGIMDTVTLANSFIKYSMERRFDFDNDSEMSKDFSEYNHKPFGMVAMYKLQSWIEKRENGILTSHIYKLHDVMKEYEVKFLKLTEY